MISNAVLSGLSALGVFAMTDYDEFPYGRGPTDSPLYGPFLKVKRADHHLDELRLVFERHVNRHARLVRAQQDKDPRKAKKTPFVPQLPEYVPTVIGDVVHNLRVSLDHAYWVFVERNGGVFNRYVKFPFGEKRSDVAGSINGQDERSRPTQAVIDFILDELQPFPDGRLHLYELHHLDIRDKHEVLLPVLNVMRLQAGETMTVTRNSDGRRIEIRHWPLRGDGPIQMASPLGLDVLDGVTLAKHSGNLKSAISICFGEGHLKGRPIIDTLEMLSANVRGSLAEMERRFL